MSSMVLFEFLSKDQVTLRKQSYNKSDKDSTDDFEGNEIKVQEKFITDQKYKTEICKNFMRTNTC